MYMEGKVTECDFTDSHYDEPVDGAHVLARGATGRWCCVMWAGPEYLAENNIETVSRKFAETFLFSGTATIIKD